VKGEFSKLAWYKGLLLETMFQTLGVWCDLAFSSFRRSAARHSPTRTQHTLGMHIPRANKKVCRYVLVEYLYKRQCQALRKARRRRRQDSWNPGRRNGRAESSIRQAMWACTDNVDNATRVSPSLSRRSSRDAKGNKQPLL
jgi:hypothetical protein